MNVLITAGATWIKIDDIRILTNKFTGATGLALARYLHRRKHRVTLLANTHCLDVSSCKFKVVPFRYFQELKRQVCSFLKNSDYDAIIHTAAVSDYSTAEAFNGKMPSRRRSLNLKLVPTPKLIKIMRRLAPRAILIQFKLEAKHKDLFLKSYNSLRRNNSDFVVANALGSLMRGPRRFIISRRGRMIRVNSDRDLARNLEAIIRLLSLKK